MIYVYVRADTPTLAGVRGEQSRTTLQGPLPSSATGRTESHRIEDLPDHPRRRYRRRQPGLSPPAWPRLGHGLHRAHDPGRRTPPRCPLPRLARSMVEEARATYPQDVAVFRSWQDRGDPGGRALCRSSRLRRLPLAFQRLVVLATPMAWLERIKRKIETTREGWR